LLAATTQRPSTSRCGPRASYESLAEERRAACARTIAGDALFQAGRHAEAMEQLTAALTVLRVEPDVMTVRALRVLGFMAARHAAPDAEALTTEAIRLAQTLGVDESELAATFSVRGAWLGYDGRRLEAVMYMRESARIAERAGDDYRAGVALSNLTAHADYDASIDGAETGRQAVRHLRRSGNREMLAIAYMNTAEELIKRGSWDAAETVFAEAVDVDGLSDVEYISMARAELAAMRGDVDRAEGLLSQLSTMRTSEDPEDRAGIAFAEARIAEALGRPDEVLRHMQVVLDDADVLDGNFLVAAWPLAARAARELHDATTRDQLLALVDTRGAAELPAGLQASADLVRAQALVERGESGAQAAYADAIDALRLHARPDVLAAALLDHAEDLGVNGSGLADMDEAHKLAEQLGSRPLLDRAERLRRT
jgi:tetratricopeptide (TPR) repeat protein